MANYKELYLLHITMQEIVFDHISKEFSDGGTAVTDISFEIAQGKALILLGKNGSGKTQRTKKVKVPMM